MRLSILLFFLISISYAQKNNSDSQYLAFFDSIVGNENTEFFNGKRYIEKLPTTEIDFPFFKTSKFLKGSIIYDNQQFYNLDLKYDLISDQLIAKLPNNNNFFLISLINERISSFTIDNNSFVNINDNEKLKSLGYKGYFQLIHDGNNLDLYIKHLKTVKKKIDKKVNYSYKENNVHLIQFDTDFYKIKSVKDIIKIFPEKKKDIRNYYNSFKSLQKSNPDLFYKNLIEFLDGRISNIINKDL